MKNLIKQKLTKSSPLVTEQSNAPAKTPFTIVEAYKSIRVRLHSELNLINGKVFAISSPFASDGKSTTAINLAITFSHLNKKILLIDADNRRSSLHKKLKLENDIGCIDILLGNCDLKSAVKSYNTYLDVMTAGSAASNPSELFSSVEFDNLLAEAKKEYDYIIIDTPPVNLVSDTLVIAQKTDGIVLVAKAKATTYKAFRFTLDAIRALDIKILGTILNSVDNNKSKYYKSKYGYGKRNKYYYYARY